MDHPIYHPANQNGSNPHILVSGASASNFYNMSGNNSMSGSHYFDDSPRRFSTQSMGPVALSVSTTYRLYVVQ